MGYFFYKKEYFFNALELCQNKSCWLSFLRVFSAIDLFLIPGVFSYFMIIIVRWLHRYSYIDWKKMMNCQEGLSKNSVVGLGLGQFLSLLITSTGLLSSELAKKGSFFLFPLILILILIMILFLLLLFYHDHSVFFWLLCFSNGFHWVSLSFFA